MAGNGTRVSPNDQLTLFCQMLSRI